MLTIRERILSVYGGETPDMVPCMLDLSHWFYHHRRLPWDLSKAYMEPERDLIDAHRAAGVGFYIANGAAFFDVTYEASVRSEVVKTTIGGTPAITWRLHTPLGSLERTRVWEAETYSWGIRDWSLKTPAQLEIFAYAMGRRRFASDWRRYRDWVACVGGDGVVYMPTGYSCMGYLLSYWMGIEGVTYAGVDFPDTLADVVSIIDGRTLDLVDLICESPADIVIMGDNFSSDVQPPRFFARWSRPFYVEAIRRLHAAGKYVAVHIDGRLHGALAMIRDCGADGADAVTPPPMGDLTARECREEAGARFVLSGGVSPDLWLPSAPLAAFDAAVVDWIEDACRNGRGILAAGDQVPPGAEAARITRIRELVEHHGRLR